MGFPVRPRALRSTKSLSPEGRCNDKVVDVLPADVPKLITIHFIRVEVDSLCAFSEVKSVCKHASFHVTHVLTFISVMFVFMVSKCTFF